ncbi:unnamed protein product, partial [Chrysoparadoxa australica]
EPKIQRLTCGGGCFWCVEGVFNKLCDGVRVYNVTSGYSGGWLGVEKGPPPTYGAICSGQTGHAEVVQVVFDRDAISYDQLLEIFWGTHDPTQGNRQGLDLGPQYRSIILYETEEEKKLAEESIAKEEARRQAGLLGGVIGGKLTTEVKELEVFFPAEPVHQDYYKKNSFSPYCIVNIEPKLAKLKPKISALLNDKK